MIHIAEYVLLKAFHSGLTLFKNAKIFRVAYAVGLKAVSPEGRWKSNFQFSVLNVMHKEQRTRVISFDTGFTGYTEYTLSRLAAKKYNFLTQIAPWGLFCM